MKASSTSLQNPRLFRRGFDHIRSRDERLASVMEKYGVIKFKAGGEIFETLVESILSQQLAGAAATAIIGKVRAIYPNGALDAAAVYKTPRRKLRAAGVSPQKIRYLKDLSGKVARGEIDLEALREMRDEDIITKLDEVEGIGPWTVQMLLIFTLGRPNVLPVDDFGIRKSVQQLYSLRELPKKAEIEKLAEKWEPYRTVASLYLWRYKDGK